jgi:hypothetical protein
LCEASQFSAARFNGLAPIGSPFVECHEEESPLKRAEKETGGGARPAVKRLAWSPSGQGR